MQLEVLDACPASVLALPLPTGNTTYQRISGSLLEGTDDEREDERPMGPPRDLLVAAVLDAAGDGDVVSDFPAPPVSAYVLCLPTTSLPA